MALHSKTRSLVWWFLETSGWTHKRSRQEDARTYLTQVQWVPDNCHRDWGHFKQPTTCLRFIRSRRSSSTHTLSSSLWWSFNLSAVRSIRGRRVAHLAKFTLLTSAHRRERQIVQFPNYIHWKATKRSRLLRILRNFPLLVVFFLGYDPDVKQP